eukprot:2955515-Rhodomonas_salina.1
MLQKISSFRYSDSTSTVSASSSECIFMLWINGLPEELKELLPSAIGRTAMRTYLSARMAWLKDWWGKVGAHHLTFSFVQGQIDTTRPLGLGFPTAEKRTNVQNLLVGFEGAHPMALAKGCSVDRNLELSFEEAEINRTQFMSIDKNHQAKTEATPSVKKTHGSKRDRKNSKRGSQTSSRESSRDPSPTPDLPKCSETKAPPLMGPKTAANPDGKDSTEEPEVTKDLFSLLAQVIKKSNASQERMQDKQLEAQKAMQADQHEFMREMSSAALMTQKAMVGLLSGKPLKQITETGSPAKDGAWEMDKPDRQPRDLNESTESFQFQVLDYEEDEQPPLVDTDFLEKERWDPTTRSDLAIGHFQGLEQCRQEILKVLALQGSTILLPFPVAQGTRLPGVWLPFEAFKDHPLVSNDMWITKQCSSPVWHLGLQGWYVITGLILKRKVDISLDKTLGCYEMKASEQLKKQCIAAKNKAGAKSPPAHSGAGNRMIPGLFLV